MTEPSAAREPLLQVEDLCTYFPVTQGFWGKTVAHVRAVDGVSFEIYEGETLGLVGESGCGKSTVGRSILRLNQPTSGRVRFLGQDLATLKARKLRQLRRHMQIVFQDPFGSLNPRKRVEDILGEPLAVHGLAYGAEKRARALQLLERVGMSADALSRYPHEFSGGQRQRIGIARALALNPKLVVCDEAVSALDVSIRAQVINLLIALRKELGLAYLFISHDLSVVRHISDRVMVMYLGQVVEVAPTAELFRVSAHPYTRALLSAIPVPDPRIQVKRVVLHGDVPSPLDPPKGCRFHTRCPVALSRCSDSEPPLLQLSQHRQVRCFHAEGTLDTAESLASLDLELRTREAKAAAEHAAQELERMSVAGVADSAPPNFPAPTQAAVGAWVPSRITWGVASGLLGFGMLATGSAFGLGIVACSYLLLRRGLLSGIPRAAALLATVTAALWIGTTLQTSRKARQAARELSTLAAEVEGYRRITGNLPIRLSELGYRLHFVFEDGRLADPWGTPYRYQKSTSEARGFQLASAGKDRVPSADDISAEDIY